jgi:hypothetical protein
VSRARWGPRYPNGGLIAFAIAEMVFPFTLICYGDCAIS